MVLEPAVEPSQLFLVRVWTSSPEFRASVRAVDEPEPHWFTTPAELARFLASGATGAAAENPAPDRADHDGPPR